MVLSRGIIKLSGYQAEGRRSEFVPLCLKYIMCLMAASAASVAWMKNYDSIYGYVWIAVAAVSLLLSIHLRTLLNYRIYRMSAEYLKRKRDSTHIKPTSVQLFGFGMTLLSVKCTVTALMLSPAALCLKFGLHSFSLSGERGQLMLMLGASFCLLLSGIIFAAVVSTHFDCAEYLFFSGKCTSAFSAIENSWVIMRGDCGDFIRLNASLIFRGIFMSSLCRINLSEKLTQACLDKRNADDLYCELRYTLINAECAAEFLH